MQRLNSSPKGKSCPNGSIPNESSPNMVCPNRKSRNRGRVKMGVDRCRARQRACKLEDADTDADADAGVRVQGCFSVPRKPSPRGRKACALQCRKGCKSEREKRPGRLHENLTFLPRELRRNWHMIILHTEYIIGIPWENAKMHPTGFPREGHDIALY